MNFATRFGEVKSYQPVTWAEWSYTIDENELVSLFDSGFIDATNDTAMVRRFADSPVETIHINKPLCKGCDCPIDNGVCHCCEIVFIDPPADLHAEAMKSEVRL